MSSINTQASKKGLGIFLILIEIVLALNVLTNLVILAFLSKGMDILDAAFFWYMGKTALDAASIWLITKRKYFAIPFIIAVSAVNIAVSTGQSIAAGDFNLGSQLLSSIVEILIILYFVFAKRPRQVLTKKFDLKSDEEYLLIEKNFFRPQEKTYWRNIAVYFCFFSIAGHWMEAGYCLLIKWGVLPGIYDPTSQIWSDWLYPFCVYGVGAVACILIFYPIKLWLQKIIKIKILPLIMSFVVNAFVCTLIEFIMGMIMNQPVDGVYPLWDYTNMFCNFMGQVCLQNAIGFGLAATVITWLVYPAFESLFARLPKEVMNIIAAAWITLFAVLLVFYCINVLPQSTDTASSAVSAISDIIPASVGI